MPLPTLLVTGMQRSGTTLLEKLLGSHPRISILSQPFPFLFLELKQEFLRRIGEPREEYPLGTLFRERRYSPAEFSAFLKAHVVDRAMLAEVFSEMEGFGGQYTRFTRTQLEQAFSSFRPGHLADTLSQLYRLLALKPDCAWHGGKETLCEEYLPFLREEGVRGVVIIRDPRDVIASLNHGAGVHFAGVPKPTLFNVRNWRKSVALALHLASQDGFLWLRYEDLVSRPTQILNRIANLLDLEPFSDEIAGHGIRDERGRLWRGNSSFEETLGVDCTPVGRYRSLLSRRVVDFVEATCWPELKHLGYPVTLRRNEIEEAIEGFVDPYPIQREGLMELVRDPRTIADERARLAALDGAGRGPERELFIFEGIPELLRSSLGDP